MSFIHFDPDEYTAEVKHEPCRSCHGDMRRCNGMCTGSSIYGLVRRPQAEIDVIKSKKRREHEDRILAEAELIRRTRRAALQAALSAARKE